MAGLDLHLDPSVGCFFIGILFSVIFYGVTCAQVLFYLWEYSMDRWWMKSVVALLFVLDTAATVADLDILWGYIVINHGNPLGLTVLTNSFLVEYAVSAATVLFVQCYYMRNVWQFLHERWYRVPLTIIALSFHVHVALRLFRNIDREVPGIFDKTKIPASLQTVAASVADIYITTSLTFILRGERTGFKHTETLIRKLTTYAINRGALTTALQIGQFFTYVLLPETSFVWAIFHFVGCKAYVNSLLAILNARHYLRTQGSSRGNASAVSAQDINLESLSRQTGQDTKNAWQRTHHLGQKSVPTPAVIKLTTTTEIIGDDGKALLEESRTNSSQA
ncbi:uncharacterized protein B0H18DRAFT_1115000 [Fomitopsis serialis]|uniref:uncharacterized protein n=1 Tax=Fomitopsis serialis TaxID=139415 RepID=UPI0020078905|nr:uncharacterized protein B0H18DRAFT_1115000 [Neoantrodia serialis]KAH9934264.1 hypothetical protein B0H18DRAFT_1115000 [Neoantrodia serialis]